MTLTKETYSLERKLQATLKENNLYYANVISIGDYCSDNNLMCGEPWHDWGNYNSLGISKGIYVNVFDIDEKIDYIRNVKGGDIWSVKIEGTNNHSENNDTPIRSAFNEKVLEVSQKVLDTFSWFENNYENFCSEYKEARVVFDKNLKDKNIADVEQLYEKAVFDLAKTAVDYRKTNKMFLGSRKYFNKFDIYEFLENDKEEEVYESIMRNEAMLHYFQNRDSDKYKEAAYNLAYDIIRYYKLTTELFIEQELEDEDEEYFIAYEKKIVSTVEYLDKIKKDFIKFSV